MFCHDKHKKARTTQNVCYLFKFKMYAIEQHKMMASQNLLFFLIILKYPSLVDYFIKGVYYKMV